MIEEDKGFAIWSIYGPLHIMDWDSYNIECRDIRYSHIAISLKCRDKDHTHTCAITCTPSAWVEIGDV